MNEEEQTSLSPFLLPRSSFLLSSDRRFTSSSRREPFVRFPVNWWLAYTGCGQEQETRPILCIRLPYCE